MISKTSNPAPVATAAGLGDVVCWLASDTRDIPPSLAEVQTKFVERRTRLRPDLARLVAELHFGRRAA